MSENILKCSLSHFAKDPCNSSTRFPNEGALITTLSDCKKDITSHLKYAKVSSYSLDNEADLICRRVGLFTTNYNLTVCPYHRYKYGLYFKQGKTCLHPQHSGGGKVFRGLNVEHSFSLWKNLGILIPFGSAICYKCYMTLSEKPLESHDPKVVETDDADHMEDDVEKQSMGYNLRERMPQNESLEQELYLDSQQSASSQSNFSQISTWSGEIETETSLDLINDSLQNLSKGAISPLRFQLRRDYDLLKESSKRAVKRKAKTAVHTVLSCIAPGQEKKMLKVIQSDDSVNEGKESNDLVQLVIKLFQESSNSLTKRQLLSMIAQKYTKTELQDLIPGLSIYCIDQARLHALEYGKGAPVQEKGHFFRQRLDQHKVAHALDFFFNPTFNQVCSFGTKEMKLQNGEKIQIPEVVRTLCHSSLIKTYIAFCKETSFEPLSLSTLYTILKSCPASKRTNLKGLDNIAADGAGAYETLSKLLAELQFHVTDQKEKLESIVKNVHCSKVYLKTDFKLHIQMEDPCPDHCIRFSLSDSSSQHLLERCHHSHEISCDRCTLFQNSIKELKQLLSCEKDLTDIKKTEMLSDIETSEKTIMLWKEHIVRSINQDKGRTDILERLEKDDCLVIMDWAMKFLPMSFREKQSDWYGQKGTNWHVSVCIFKDECNNLKHRTYAHIFEAVKQDWFAVASIIEHLMVTIKKQIPKVKTVFLRSDNAGCYHCGNLWLALPGISLRTGIHISRYDFSESQCGKSYCDAKIAHMRGRIRQFVANGNNVRNATEMKTAIESFGGIVGCQAANVQVDNEQQTSYAHSWKGITKISNLSFNKNGSITWWKAYGIGEGVLISKEDFTKLCQIPQNETGLIIIEEFKELNALEGNVKHTILPSVVIADEAIHPVEQQEVTESNIRNVLECPEDGCNVLECPQEGCTRVFQSYRGLEMHQLMGVHKFLLNKMSAYDEIKLKWQECCTNLTDQFSVQKYGDGTQQQNQSKADLMMGWALRKDRKINRFSEKVKMFLRGMFEAGAHGGRKANPVEVSNHMRVCLDEDGNKMFEPKEYLHQGQITSYFSRLAVMTKMPPSKRQHIDDTDLESIVVQLNTMDAIDIINTDI